MFSSEWDKFSQKTYAANFGELPHGDITAISASEIPAHDILLAGFPCQAFSQAGLKKGFQDTRGTLFFDIQRILTAHRPRMFLLEKKQLRGMTKGAHFRLSCQYLKVSIPNYLKIFQYLKKPKSLSENGLLGRFQAEAVILCATKSAAGLQSDLTETMAMLTLKIVFHGQHQPEFQPA